MDSPSSRELVVEFLEAVWNDGNVDAAAKYVADDYTIHHDPGDPWEGRRLTLAEFQDRVRISRKSLPGLRFTVQEVLADDDKVMITWLCNATLSGAPISTSGATVYYLDGEKISGHWQVALRPAPARS